MSKPLIVVLDTCVLYPAVIRDTLLLAAEAGIFQLRWTDAILTELRRNLVGNLAAPEASVNRTLASIEQAFEDGRVTGYERHINTARNHLKDRHVVAAAIEGEAELIVTENLSDFRPADMPPGIRAVSVDEFLGELLERSPAEIIDVLWTQAIRKKRPPISVARIVAAVAKTAPNFCAAAQPYLGVRTDEQLLTIALRLEQAISSLNATQPALDELSAALADACVVDVQFAVQNAREARRHAPKAVRILAKMHQSGDRGAAQILESYRIDADEVDLMSLTDDEIITLLGRNRGPSQ